MNIFLEEEELPRAEILWSLLYPEDLSRSTPVGDWKTLDHPFD